MKQWLNEIVSRISIGKLLIVVILALAIATPLEQNRTYFISTPDAPSKIRALDKFINLSEPVAGNIAVPTSALSSGAFLSSLVGFDLTPMPIKVCLINDMQIKNDLKPLYETAVGSEELGDMAISIDLGGEEEMSLFAKQGKTSCLHIPRSVNYSVINKQLEVKTSYIANENAAIQILEPGNSRIEVHVEINFVQYILNLFRSVLAIALLIELGGALWKFLSRKPNAQSGA